MKKVKKALSVILSALILLSAFGVAALAGGNVLIEGKVDGFNYVLTQDMTLTINGKGTLPEELCPGLSDGWEQYATKITSVILGEGVTKIPDAAFDSCVRLESVSLPSTLLHIGYEAFYKCISLKSIDIPKKVGAVNADAFLNCISLKDITVRGMFTNTFESGLGLAEFRLTASVEEYLRVSDELKAAETELEPYLDGVFEEIMEKIRADIQNGLVNAEAYDEIFILYEKYLEEILTERNAGDIYKKIGELWKLLDSYIEYFDGKTVIDGACISAPLNSAAGKFASMSCVPFKLLGTDKEICTCMCHSKGLTRVLVKILFDLFRKIGFGQLRYCTCGADHWNFSVLPQR